MRIDHNLNRWKMYDAVYICAMTLGGLIAGCLLAAGVFL